MPLPIAYSLANWTATLTCGAAGAQQSASLGGMLTEFTPPEIKHSLIKKKFAGTGGITPIPTGTFEEIECGFKLELTSDSLETATARSIIGAATLVITSPSNTTNDLGNRKTMSYTLVGQIEKVPYIFGLKAGETGEAELSMIVTDISKTWGSTTRQLNPIKFELMEGLTNFLADLKTGMNI